MYLWHDMFWYDNIEDILWYNNSFVDHLVSHLIRININIVSITNPISADNGGHLAVN